MTTPTPDNAARETPVAWVERTEGGLTRMWSGDLSAWAHRPANPEPLYSAATVTALEARVAVLSDALQSISSMEGTESDEWDAVERVIPEMARIAQEALTGAGAK